MSTRWPGTWAGQWPGDWLGEQVADGFANMGAVITASGALVGSLDGDTGQTFADMGAVIGGAGSLSATLQADAAQAPAPGGGGWIAAPRRMVRYANASATLAGGATLIGTLETSRGVRYADMGIIVPSSGTVSARAQVAQAIECAATLPSGGALVATVQAAQAAEGGMVATGTGRMDARLSIVLRAVEPPGVVLADDELIAVLRLLAA